MKTVAHAMPQPGRAQRRVTGLLFALLLQVGLITALVIGLDIKVWPAPDAGIETKFIPTKTHVDYPPPPPSGGQIEPKHVDLPQPTIIFDTGDGAGTAIDPNNRNTGARPGPADHGPLGIAATHTTPPYPPIEVRLGAQGTVLLRLVINPQGVVADATVVRSSGFPILDEAARAWVVGRWRYQPAIRGGVAVPATTTVGVEFNLRNAG